MKLSKQITATALALVLASGAVLSGCQQQTTSTEPDFSGYKEVAELATYEYTFHNVAEVKNDGTPLFAGITAGYKLAWFEYSGTVSVGIDASKVTIDTPDENGVVTIHIPSAQIIGDPVPDVNSFSDVYSDTGIFTKITAEDQTEAYGAAQQSMRESVEGNNSLIQQAQTRAETLLSNYVQEVGTALGKTYTVKFVDADESNTTSSSGTITLRQI